MNGITIVGVGPGDPQYVTLRAQQIIQQAEVVAGFATVLEVVAPWITGRLLPLDYRNQEAQLARLSQEARGGRRCVVCAWGDPSFSAQELVDRVRRACGQVWVEPGLSSVQVACARAGLPLERAVWVTLHSREGAEEALAELVEVLRGGRRHAVVLPRPWDLMPAAVAKLLIQREVQPDLPALVYERLTLPGERAHRMSLEALARSRRAFSDLSLLVLPSQRE